MVVGSKSARMTRGVIFPLAVVSKNGVVLFPGQLPTNLPSGRTPCSRQYNSQQA